MNCIVHCFHRCSYSLLPNFLSFLLATYLDHGIVKGLGHERTRINARVDAVDCRLMLMAYTEIAAISSIPTRSINSGRHNSCEFGKFFGDILKHRHWQKARSRIVSFANIVIFPFAYLVEHLFLGDGCRALLPLETPCMVVGEECSACAEMAAQGRVKGVAAETALRHHCTSRAAARATLATGMARGGREMAAWKAVDAVAACLLTSLA